MLVTGIKSKPTYTTLVPDLGGRYHLFIGQGSGGEALLRVLEEMPGDADLHVIYCRESTSGNDHGARLQALGLADLRLYPTIAEAVEALDATLAHCVMGTRVYIVGSESFIGSCVQVTTNYNLNADEVQREHRGSAARRVYCIHCKTQNEDVRTNIVDCAGCGRHLLVRDHYSRRLAAFMGVMVDAEAPGEVPPIEEVFS